MPASGGREVSCRHPDRGAHFDTHAACVWMNNLRPRIRRQLRRVGTPVPAFSWSLGAQLSVQRSVAHAHSLVLLGQVCPRDWRFGVSPFINTAIGCPTVVISLSSPQHPPLCLPIPLSLQTSHLSIFHDTIPYLLSTRHGDTRPRSNPCWPNVPVDRMPWSRSSNPGHRIT